MEVLAIGTESVLPGEDAPLSSAVLKRDDFGMNRHRALARCLGMIFSENRFTLFRIMPLGSGMDRN
jgi:hypothetical protein